MTLRILVDECILDRLLVGKLIAAGHDVATVTDLGLTRKSDHQVFAVAIDLQRMILTVNCADFVELSESHKFKSRGHPGLLLLYRHNIPSKELSYDDVVRALANLEATGIQLANLAHKLNDYKY